MSVDILTSRKRNGTAPCEEAVISRFLEDYKKASFAQKQNMLVLVPDQMSHQAEEMIMQELGEGGLIGVRIYGQNQLFKHLYGLFGLNDQAYLDEHGQMMLMYKAILDTSEDLSLYAKSASSPEFSKKIASQINQMRLNGIESENLEEHLESVPSRLLRQKLHDLSVIYRQYQKLLGENRMDEELRLQYLKDFIEKSGYGEKKSIYMYGFTGFDELHTAVMTTLFKQAKKVSFSLIADTNRFSEDSTVFDSNRAFLERMTAVMKEEGLAYQIQELALKDQDPEKTLLEQALFSYRQPKQKWKAKSIDCFSQENPFDEVLEIALRIEGCRKEGLSYDDIGVVCCDFDQYAPQLTRMLSMLNIPYFLDRREPVIESILSKSMLLAMDAVSYPSKTEELLSFSKSYFSPLTAEESDRLENFMIEAGVRAKDLKEGFALRRLDKRVSISPEELDEMDTIREKLLAPLKLITRRKIRASEHSDRIRQMMHALNVSEKLNKLLEELEEQQDQQRLVYYRQIYENFLDVLAQMDESLGDEKMNLSAYSKVFAQGLRSYSVGVIPQSNESIKIMDMDRSKLGKIHTLFVCGANEGVLPPPASQNDLISETEIRSAPELLSGLDRKYSSAASFSFYEKLTSVTSKLCFSYALTNTTGQAMEPSSYLSRLDKYFDFSENSQIPMEQQLESGHLLLTLEQLREEDYPGLAETIRHYFCAHPEHPDYSAFQKREEARLSPQADDHVDRELVRSLYQKHPVVSVSRLERFAACPYGHYLERGLRIKEREAYQVRPLDTGNLMHEVLETFYEKLTGLDDQTFHDQLVCYADSSNDALETALNAIFDAIEKEGSYLRYQNSASAIDIFRKIRRMLMACLRVQAKQLLVTGFRPSRLETQFRYPVALDEATNIEIQGRIDRIDQKENQFSIIDYKSGSQKKLLYSEIQAGLSMQLLMYLQVAMNELGKDHDPVGCFYSFLKLNPLEGGNEAQPKDARMRGLCDERIYKDLKDEVLIAGTDAKLSQEEMRLLTDFIQNKVQELSVSLFQGETDLRPYENQSTDTCKYCPYQNLCRKRGRNLMTRKLEPMSKKEFFQNLGDNNELDG